MTYSGDLRWRAIVLVYVYGVETDFVASVLGTSAVTIRRWLRFFEVTGNPHGIARDKTSAPRWSHDVLSFVEEYVRVHPCFYIEELQNELRKQFPRTTNVSASTICRALRFDLNLARKILTTRARESAPRERRKYVERLAPLYSGPDQPVFVDETAKDSRSALRKFAWSKKGKVAVVKLPSSRGQRLSVLAAMDVHV